MPAQNLSQAWTAVWHLVMATAGGITALLASEMWQKRSELRYRATHLAFGALAVLQLLLAGLALWSLTPMPIAHALDTACALLVGWGLVSPHVTLRVQRIWLGAIAAAALALAVGAGLSLASGGPEPTWSLLVWGLLSALGTGGGALVLAFCTQERLPFALGTLSVLGLNALLWVVGLEPLGRALWLAAFITLPVTMIRRILNDLENNEQELQTFSQHSLRQTQQLLTLLRSSISLMSSTSVSDMLAETAESIAVGSGADMAIIGLIGDDADKTVGLMSIYPPRGTGVLPSFPLNSHAVVAQAVHDNQQTPLEATVGLEQHPLYVLMGGKEAGPALVQPMTSQERTIGVIIVGRNLGNDPLGDDAGRLLSAMSAQVATAVENVQMYHRLRAQARELARLLNIREEEATQRAAILESIADGVVVTDRDDKIILVNAAASTILNMPRSHLIGLQSEAVFESVIPIPLSVFRVSDDASMVQTVRLNFEVNGRSVQTSLAPVQTQGGELLGVVAVLRDVTRERQAELAKTEFIATISHELRTPLTTIKASSDLMRAGALGELSEMQGQFVGKICQQTNHLIHLINAVIQYSELERSSPSETCQVFDLGKIVGKALESFRERLEARGFSAALNVQPGLPHVYADPLHTQQIVEQLIDNALRFTPEPGHLILSVRSVYESYQPDRPSHACVAISDNGVGIAPEDIDHIFDRFYRADNPLQVEAGGLGLGLTIARAQAMAQSGKLWAESPAIESLPGEALADRPGATFTLQLPAVEEESK